MISVCLSVTLLLMPQGLHEEIRLSFIIPSKHSAVKSSRVSNMDPPLHLLGNVFILKNSSLTDLRKAKAVQSKEDRTVNRSCFTASVWSKKKSVFKIRNIIF